MFYPHYTLQLHEPAHHEHNLRGLKDHRALHRHYKVVLNALLTPGDIILYDRNNHKSICHGGLVMSGATPIYLETARNPFWFHWRYFRTLF